MKLKPIVSFIGSILLCAQGHATILFETSIYWTPRGTFFDPVRPPEDAWVYIHEVVYDDVGGRQVIADGSSAWAIQPTFVNPNRSGEMELYTFSVTNLRYGNGPMTAAGRGITAFEVPVPTLPGAIPLASWGPTWGPQQWEGSNPYSIGFRWQVNPDRGPLPLEGAGTTLGYTTGGFMFAVEHGAPRRTSGANDPWRASIHSWSETGQVVDRIVGEVVIPVPESVPNLMWAYAVGPWCWRRFGQRQHAGAM